MTPLPSQQPDAAHPGKLWTPWITRSACQVSSHSNASCEESLSPTLVHPFDTDEPDPLRTFSSVHTNPSDSISSSISYQDTLLQASDHIASHSSRTSSDTASNTYSIPKVPSQAAKTCNSHFERRDEGSVAGATADTSRGKLYPLQKLLKKHTDYRKFKFYPQAQFVPLYEMKPSLEDYKLQIKTPDIEGGDMIERAPLKKLFGDGGLLEDHSRERQAKRSKRGFRSLKTKASSLFGDMTQTVNTIASETRHQHHSYNMPGSQTYAEPKAQANLLAHLEVLVQSEASRFIEYEFSSGRVSPQSVSALKRLWEEAHRPEIQGFCYDIGTQLRLCNLNAWSIRWTGEHATSKEGVRALLDTWKKLHEDLQLCTYGLSDYYVRSIILRAGTVIESLDPSIAGRIELQSIKEGHSAMTLARGAGRND